MTYHRSTLSNLKHFREQIMDDRPDEMKFGWEETGHTMADVTAMQDQLADLIPAGATHVLEIGCRDGTFSEVIKTKFPSIQYTGVDLIIDNIEAAESSYPGRTFEVSTAWDALLEESPAWDFVVSCNWLWSYTESRWGQELLQLLNAKAAKGWAVLVQQRQLPSPFETQFADIIASSSGVTDSYVSGPRTTLTSDLTRDLVPYWVHRSGAGEVSIPIIPDRLQLVSKSPDRYNKIIARHDFKRAKKDGGPMPTTLNGLDPRPGKGRKPGVAFDFSRWED